MTKIQYTDNREFFVCNLESYPKGIMIKKGSVLEVTDYDLKKLMRMNNGGRPSWERMRQRKESIETTEE